MLLGNNHPQLIVYGLGPRDFLDNLLLSPASTDPYRCLCRYLSKPLILSFIGQDWQPRLNYFFCQHLSLYEQKENIVAGLMKEIVLATPLPSKRMGLEQLHTLLPTYNPMSIRINECLFNPDQAIDPDRFTKNLNEYRQRYHQLNWETFTCQTKFYIDFLKLASRSKIKILIAAMPITSINRQLLPEYMYTTYKENLRVLSKLYGANFIDLDEKNCFSDQDFLDTVHLNAAGGTKFLELLSQYITQHRLIDRDRTDHSRLADIGIKI
jgi:hypothetical protein